MVIFTYTQMLFRELIKQFYFILFLIKKLSSNIKNNTIMKNLEFILKIRLWNIWHFNVISNGYKLRISHYIIINIRPNICSHKMNNKFGTF